MNISIHRFRFFFFHSHQPLYLAAALVVAAFNVVLRQLAVGAALLGRRLEVVCGAAAGHLFGKEREARGERERGNRRRFFFSLLDVEKVKSLRLHLFFFTFGILQFCARGEHTEPRSHLFYSSSGS